MKERTVIAWILCRIRKRIPALVGLVLANGGSALLGVLFALGTRQVINGAVDGQKEAFYEACLIQLVIIAGMLLCMFLARYLREFLVEQMDKDRKNQLLHAVLHGEYERVNRFHSGEIVNRLNNDVRILNEGVVSLLPGLVSMVVRLAAAVCVLLVLEPLFTCALLVVGCFAVVITGAMRRYLKQLNKNVSKEEGRVLSFIQEAAERLLIVQAMDISDEVERRADTLLDQRLQAQKKRRRLSLSANTGVSVLYYGAGFAALVWCARGLLLGTMSFGTMSVITQLVSQLQAPFVNLSGLLPRYAAVIAAAERLMELEESCVLDEESSAPMAGGPLCSIGAKDLCFGYDGELVFQNAEFEIPAGSFVAVTGHSGIGKSTLLKLILGIFRPWGGRVHYDNGEEQISLSRQTRGLFSYVPQGNFLFSGTLRDNLLIANPQAGEEEIRQALYISAVDEFLPDLPQGLDTILGENGEGLSEGQDQRIAIARAVLSGAPILLLDEATSAMDGETERVVLQRISSLRDRTCIVVTHRPAVLEFAQWQLEIRDRMIVQTEL